MSVSLKALSLASCILAGPLQAHEFWIEAEDYTVAPGERVTATFRNGEELEGSALSYLPGNSNRFDMVMDGEVRAVPARIGDNPAFDVADLPEGLLTIVHETGNLFVTYEDWDSWARFTEHKDFAFAQQAHLDRGLPETGFRETYRRYAKALVAVGDGAGRDAARGFEVEFVAEANPYTDDLSDGLPVRLLYGGAPRADGQIEMFARDAAGAVAVTYHRTDAEGRAVLPVEPGTEYMLDHVEIRPTEPEREGDAVWRTLWAALTFATPEA
ncbi:DUF4198 domain-containing protein [uncultured Jannaschia sp.]|uniref:DUF4198 domain-containing protein n=1 Tax=uncultured Jannaschia sp. TaxID=293347 RepID=UPI002636C9DE|nr:DUF4198 domain-containing protein [uncultured Jannaschia sp.]